MSKEAIKKMLIGEPMPDKDDPKYKERYESDVEAGRRFARIACIDKAIAKTQDFALRHTKTFLVIVFGFIGLSFFMNIAKMAMVCNSRQEYKTATEKQDSLMKKRGFTSVTTANKDNTTVKKP